MLVAKRNGNVVCGVSPSPARHCAWTERSGQWTFAQDAERETLGCLFGFCQAVDVGVITMRNNRATSALVHGASVETPLHAPRHCAHEPECLSVRIGLPFRRSNEDQTVQKQYARMDKAHCCIGACERSTCV